MSNETIIPTSDDTKTIILNIEGILNNLKPIIDKNVFEALNETFNSIKDNKDTFDSESIKVLANSYPGMLENLIKMSGSSTRQKLKEFEIKTIESYERYYSFKLKVEEFRSILDECNPNIENQKANIVFNTIELLNLLSSLSSGLAPELIQDANELIFESLIITDDDLIIKEIEKNEFVKENIGRKMQPYVPVSTRSIDYDFLDHESIHNVQKSNSYISELIERKQREFENIQYIQYSIQHGLNEKISDLDIKINTNNETIKEYKVSKRNVILKKALIGSIIPFYLLTGYIIGKDVARKNPLYETETQVVDLTGDSPVVIDKYTEYDQTNTEYVSTVTIASPWEQTISGGDIYTRSVNVYSFTKPEGAEDGYRLKKEDLIDENLSLKYHYNETTSGNVHPDKQEIIVTETWQNKNNFQENQGPVSAGLGWGFFLGILTLAGGYFLNRKMNYGNITSSTPIYEYNKMIKELNEENNNLEKEKESIVNSNNENDEIDYVALLAKRTSDEQEVGFQKTK